MSNIGSYEIRVKDFDWKMSEEELGYGKNGKYNVGYFCSDRICEIGNGKKVALLWEGLPATSSNIRSTIYGCSAIHLRRC